MSKFYVPEGIGSDYKYVVPSANYYDIYDTPYLEPNRNYTYYRFYNSVDESYFVELERSTTNYNYGTLACFEIEPTNDYLYRRDYPQILQCVFMLTIGFVLLINIMTSCVRKGGVLSGLF